MILERSDLKKEPFDVCSINIRHICIYIYFHAHIDMHICIIIHKPMFIQHTALQSCIYVQQLNLNELWLSRIQF